MTMTPFLTKMNLLSIAATLAFATTTPARADEAAEAFIKDILVDANIVFEATDKTVRDAGIEALVDKYVDMDRVARFALGQYARQATAEQMSAYKPLFRKYATSVYQSTLDAYTGERLEVVDSVDRSARDYVVNTKVVDARPGSQYVDLVVHWRVYRDADGKQSVVDAGASGVWLAIEQQSTFKSVIANNGGGSAGIDALITDLKTKVGE